MASRRRECWTCASTAHDDADCPNVIRAQKGGRARGALIAGAITQEMLTGASARPGGDGVPRRLGAAAKAKATRSAVLHTLRTRRSLSDNVEHQSMREAREAVLAGRVSRRLVALRETRPEQEEEAELKLCGELLASSAAQRASRYLFTKSPVREFLVLMACGAAAGLGSRGRLVCLWLIVLRYGWCLWVESSPLWALRALSLQAVFLRGILATTAMASTRTHPNEFWIEALVSSQGPEGDQNEQARPNLGAGVARESLWKVLARSAERMRLVGIVIPCLPPLVNAFSLLYFLQLTSRVKSHWILVGFGTLSTAYMAVVFADVAWRGPIALNQPSAFMMLEAFWSMIMLGVALVSTNPPDWAVVRPCLSAALMMISSMKLAGIPVRVIERSVRVSLAATFQEAIRVTRRRKISFESASDLALFRWLLLNWSGAGDLDAGRLHAGLYHEACAVLAGDDVPVGELNGEGTRGVSFEAGRGSAEGHDHPATGRDSDVLRGAEMCLESSLETAMCSFRRLLDVVLKDYEYRRDTPVLLLRTCPCLCAVLLRLVLWVVTALMGQPTCSYGDVLLLLVVSCHGPGLVEVLRLRAMRAELRGYRNLDMAAPVLPGSSTSSWLKQLKGCLHEVQDGSPLPQELGDGNPPPSHESLDGNTSSHESVDETLSLREVVHGIPSPREVVDGNPLLRDAMDGNPWRREHEYENPSLREPRDASLSAHGREGGNPSLQNPREEVPSISRTEGDEEPISVYDTGTPMSPERENPEVVQLGPGEPCFPRQKCEKEISVDEPEVGNPPIDEHADGGSPIGRLESNRPSKREHLELADHVMHELRGVIGGAIEAVTECPPGAVLGLLGLEW